MIRTAALVLLAALCACGGCATGKPGQQAAADGGKKGHEPPMGASFFPQSALDANNQPRDPAADPRILVQLNVYKLTVPARTVSHNEEFWKHVDETTIDVAQHDILFTNGFRVGIAPRSDWDYFKKILERDNVISQLSGSGGLGGSAMEIPFKQNVPEDTIFYIHPTKGLIGQIYDKHDEEMSITFKPVPRQPGDVRIALTPLFISQRTEIFYTDRNVAQPLTTFGHKHYEFDLNLQADVPLDHFLIIAPSADADEHTASLGNKMMCFATNGEQFETVLILAPQPFVFDSPTAPATQPATKPSVAEK
jgi:hypothetical protein